jgi:hypothetical protein
MSVEYRGENPNSLMDGRRTVTQYRRPEDLQDSNGGSVELDIRWRKRESAIRVPLSIRGGLLLKRERSTRKYQVLTSLQQEDSYAHRGETRVKL